MLVTIQILKKIRRSGNRGFGLPFKKKYYLSWQEWGHEAAGHIVLAVRKHRIDRKCTGL